MVMISTYLNLKVKRLVGENRGKENKKVEGVWVAVGHK
jgi:hypothetical protein